MATKKKNTTPPAKGKTTKTALKSEAAKAAPETGEARPKLSLLKAAIAVLEECEEAMNAKSLVEAAKERGLWTPTDGKTPEQTLYSAIAREIKAKGENARFKLVSKGHFKLNTH